MPSASWIAFTEPPATPSYARAVHIVLLAAEKGLIAAEIADIVRADEQTVRRWLKRYLAQGLSGLFDSPRPGGPRKVTAAFLLELSKWFITANHLPATFHLWTHDRLADFMAQKTGIAVILRPCACTCGRPGSSCATPALTSLRTFMQEDVGASEKSRLCEVAY